MKVQVMRIAKKYLFPLLITLLSISILSLCFVIINELVGAAADSDGDSFIITVPPGTYQLELPI